MTTVPKITDAHAREQALDPTRSFIVQAPAGSGKTGLLTQRFLVLLSGVENPEEIVAITFTRKAAAEMRQRVLKEMYAAQESAPPEQPHELRTWELARKALARDQAQGWKLLDNPGRLRIQTIDSLCASLARQMPMLSGFGASPAICEDPQPLYLEAARRTIARLDSEQWSEVVAHLVQHLDNRLDRLQSLIATMLAKREQWLPHIIDDSKRERKRLESAMARLVEEHLAGLTAVVPAGIKEELPALARFAASNRQGSESRIAACDGLERLPAASAEEVAKWEGIAELLQTARGEWRKTVNTKQGFPAAGDAENAGQKVVYLDMKDRMKNILQQIDNENELKEMLGGVPALPQPRYREDEWRTLCALVEVLRLAAGELRLVFGEAGQVDFSEMSRAAIEALGDDEAPTDLALALDYRIQHLLVDEFQDTSSSQYTLLERLTAGWIEGDGRSLFLVGDPMQSIYRFREAEVGLFLQARANGMGHVPLESLQLEVNFRSQAGIVQWLNENFSKVLPEAEQVAAGAISYAQSSVFHPTLEGPGVTVHPYLNAQREDEARDVASLVKQAAQAHPGGTTAILVRGRTHLADIAGQLKLAGLRFQAVEIESLTERPVVQDLLALTRALHFTGDRIAWLAVLRAPSCGLSLDDLFRLAGAERDRPVMELLHREELVGGLSEGGRQRIARVLPIFDAALNGRGRGNLRAGVEGVWISLGGPACVGAQTDLEDAEVYFRLLEQLDDAGEVTDFRALREQVDKLFALPDTRADHSLQLMTIHKAKGLEFDTVIVPGLGRLPRHNEKQLLYWLERPRQDAGADLLLAPIPAQGEEENRAAKYLKKLDKEKSHYEDGRLLYVAATRAKRHLHLLGHADVKEEDGVAVVREPRRETLLASLWPVVREQFEEKLNCTAMDTTDEPDEPGSGAPDRRRQVLPPTWAALSPPETVNTALPAPPMDRVKDLEFDWAGETARHVGTVVHRLLQYLGEPGVEKTEASLSHRLEPVAMEWLCRAGIARDKLADATQRALRAIQKTLADSKGRWILDSGHNDAQSELALSRATPSGVEHLVIDRTFVDKDGTRWIIDYKTGMHTGGGRDEFLDREQERYRDQLEGYANTMSATEERPIRLGLYFPLLGGWREWEYLGSGSESNCC